MKRASFYLRAATLVALVFGSSGHAHGGDDRDREDDNLRGKHSIVGQWTGSFADGSDAADLVLNLGGTGNLADEAALGGGPAGGSPGFASLTWRRIERDKVAIRLAALNGVPSIMQIDDGSFGVFPIIGFYRQVGDATATLAPDSTTMTVRLTKICPYNTATIADQNVNTATPLNCTEFSPSTQPTLIFHKVDQPEVERRGWRKDRD